MEKDKHLTKVRFYLEKPEKTVLAVFPAISEGANRVSCYQHLGQHSAAHLDYIRTLKEARPDQYLDLYKELENLVGYNLWILNEVYRYLVPQLVTTNGAQMGRPNVLTGKPKEINGNLWYPLHGRVFDRAIYINSQGYDKGGAYWGIGAPLRVRYTKDLQYIEYYRK